MITMMIFNADKVTRSKILGIGKEYKISTPGSKCTIYIGDSDLKTPILYP